VATEAPPPAPVSEAAAFAALFERLARDPSIDPARIQQFLQMKREEEDRQAERAYNASMAAAQAELIPVARNRPNDQTHSKYADLAAIAEAAMPIIHSHGFGLGFSEFQSHKEGHMGVACKVSHAGGFSERYEFHIPVDCAGLRGNSNKTATHAYGSTFSYGRRYATCGVFNIATKDDNDGNAAGRKNQPVERVTEEQLAKLNALLQKTQEPAASVQITLQRFKVDNLTDLTPKQYELCVKKLNEAIGAHND
jgi:hypothetical protein